MNKVEALVLLDTENQHLATTIRLSSGKKCLLSWPGEVHMNMTNGSLNARTCNSGNLMVSTLHQHLFVGHITHKALQRVLVPMNTLSAMDVQTHLPTLPLSCLRGPNILRINFQHPTQCISQIQGTRLISTSRVSIPLPNQGKSHNWHNPYPLTVRYLRLFLPRQSNLEHIHDQRKRTINQWRVGVTSKATTIPNILP